MGKPQGVNSADYWIARYKSGHYSGPGSRGRLAEFKAEVVNAFVAEHQVASLIEFGCGDGHQLLLAKYPSYLGLDISPYALNWCREMFAGDASKRFALMADYAGEVADASLSLDVIYHLMEDEVFEQYMQKLFGAARRFVVVYSNNFEQEANHHCRPRRFTDWIERHAKDWKLLQHIPNRYPYTGNGWNESDADFYIYANQCSHSDARRR